jgi:hypothetical protein
MWSSRDGRLALGSHLSVIFIASACARRQWKAGARQAESPASRHQKRENHRKPEQDCCDVDFDYDTDSRNGFAAACNCTRTSCLFRCNYKRGILTPWPKFGGNACNGLTTCASGHSNGGPDLGTVESCGWIALTIRPLWESPSPCGGGSGAFPSIVSGPSRAAKNPGALRPRLQPWRYPLATQCPRADGAPMARR